MKTYDEADAYLKAGRDPNHRAIPSIKATSVERRGEDCIALKYHATDVVTWWRGGVTTLNSGGWRTMTTKERMCIYSPAVVFQEMGLWYVQERRPDGRINVIYSDEIEINRAGMVINPPPIGTTEGTEKVKRRVDRMVQKYTKGYIEHIQAVGEVEKPSGGDCWSCLFRVSTNKEDEPSSYYGFGASSSNPPEVMGVDHLLAHFEEGYYVPSLLISAIREQNYSNPDLIVQLINSDLKRGTIGLYHVTNAMRAYFRKRKVKLVEVLMRQGVGV